MTDIANTEDLSSNNSKGAPKAYIEVDFDLCYVGKVYNILLCTVYNHITHVGYVYVNNVM